MFKGLQDAFRDNKSLSYPAFELPRVNFNMKHVIKFVKSVKSLNFNLLNQLNVL